MTTLIAYKESPMHGLVLAVKLTPEHQVSRLYKIYENRSYLAKGDHFLLKDGWGSSIPSKELSTAI